MEKMNSNMLNARDSCAYLDRTSLSQYVIVLQKREIRALLDRL